MHNIKELYEKRLDIRAQQSFDLTEEDYIRIIPKLDLLEQIANMERSIYAVYDNYKNNFILQSEDQKQLYKNVVTNDDQIETHYNYIHPDDLAFVLETDNLTPLLFSRFDLDDQMHIKVIYDFRVKNAAGGYSRYMHQIMILEQDKNKKPWLILVISNLLSNCPANYKPERKAVDMRTGTMYFFDDSEQDNVPLLTNREFEILTLISQGYDNNAIAEKLHISTNTINNHRRNIIIKTKSTNITNAILYLKRLGLI